MLPRRVLQLKPLQVVVAGEPRQQGGVLVQGVVERLREAGVGDTREIDGIPENMEFALPKELRLRLRA